MMPLFISAMVGWLIAMYLSYLFAQKSDVPLFIDILLGVAIAFILVPLFVLCTSALIRRNG
jgi:hypothetical protein